MKKIKAKINPLYKANEKLDKLKEDYNLIKEFLSEDECDEFGLKLMEMDSLMLKYKIKYYYEDIFDEDEDL